MRIRSLSNIIPNEFVPQKVHIIPDETPAEFRVFPSMCGQAQDLPLRLLEQSLRRTGVKKPPTNQQKHLPFLHTQKR